MTRIGRIFADVACTLLSDPRDLRAIITQLHRCLSAHLCLSASKIVFKQSL
jgi:hypothetical protein